MAKNIELAWERELSKLDAGLQVSNAWKLGGRASWRERQRVKRIKRLRKKLQEKLRN